ncbi:hypothetical protein RBB75_06260 [Tunturibacter empetritectus]|uniref:GPR1/FUN34/yaaH family protein n=1 Tax=Tunturiibacter empetritectus TaxID=3069691 RepID=A0AAU7ZGK4_9BACT
MSDENTKPADVQSITRIVVRPYGTALPLGCFGFGVGNALLSAYALHWIPLADTKLLAVMLLAFVAPLELIPCIMAFLSRDSGGATAMGIFAAAWVVQGVEFYTGVPGSTSIAMGVFLLLLALILIVLTVVTFPGKPLLGVLLTIAILRSSGGGLVQFGFGGGAVLFAAWTGFLLAAFAFYSGLGFLMEDVKQRPLAMTFRRKEAKAALQGDLSHQLKPLANEAGVRQQL